LPAWIARLVGLIAIGAAVNVYWMHGRAPQVPADIHRPERTVSGQTLTSMHAPAVALEFAPGFAYAGAQRFLLYGVASAEQHFFVDADADKRIRRMYWVQFEGYLPDNTSTYDYSKSQGRAQIGGLEFFTDTYAAAVTPPRRPDSDGARARELLQSKGYRYPAEVLSIRLVHLTDATRRAELMIIYAEDLASFGVTAEQVAEPKMQELSAEILKRARQNLRVIRTAARGGQ